MLGRLDLPDDAFQPFSPNDQAKARVLLESAFCATHSLWREEVDAMVCSPRRLDSFLENGRPPIQSIWFDRNCTRTTHSHTGLRARENLKCELETLNLVPTSRGRRDALAQFVQRALLQGDFV